MAAYLASPFSATPQLPSGNRSVASVLGSTRGVGSVMGSVGAHVPSSAPPMGGPGVPGGTSAPLVGLPGRRPDLDNGASASGYLHPDLGIPPSLGGLGVHTGVSSLDMGVSGFPSPWIFLNQAWRVPVSPGGHLFYMGGILVAGRIRTKGSHPLLDPIMPQVYLAPWLLPAPFAALPPPLWWWFPHLTHPVAAPPSHPWFLFRVIPGIIWLRVLLSAVSRGGAPPLHLPAHVVALLAVRLRQFTPFLPRYVIGVLRVRSGMSPIGQSRRQMTFPFLRSRFRWTNLLCHPSSWARTI